MNHYEARDREAKRRAIMRMIIITAGILSIIASLIIALWAGPQYKVYSQELSGKASLMRQKQERKILVEQAQAELDAAKIRAQAIKVVGQAAKDFPEYRLQEFMAAYAEALNSDKIEQIIYVPTEAGIPLLEAGKLVPRQ